MDRKFAFDLLESCECIRDLAYLRTCEPGDVVNPKICGSVNGSAADRMRRVLTIGLLLYRLILEIGCLRCGKVRYMREDGDGGMCY